MSEAALHAMNQVIRESTTGAAWLKVVDLAATNYPDRLLHVRLTITDPGAEDLEVRVLVDQMLKALKKAPVQTVVNTLFPAVLARLSKSPQELSSRYTAMYKRIRREAGANNRGTYFGRIVCYPARDEPVNQLTRLIDQLRRDQSAKKTRPAAIYETTTTTSAAVPAQDRRPLDDTSDATSTEETQVYAPTPDTIPMGFPCLSHLSWQRLGGRLHLLAQYRHEYLIERAYGNYLALGLLQRYVANAAGLEVGELSVDAGLCTLDVTPATLEKYLAQLHQTSLW
jgi:thymidylate synthase